ncbi:putative ribonuclease H-like domain-containing protein [Tanacetum coccineum]
MALLSMRARKFYQRTGRKIIVVGSNTTGYDKSKVECFNCYKMRSKDNRNWNQGSSTKAVKIEDASEKAMCAIDGAGFDWSDMAEEEIQANMALMAFSDSEVTNDKSCSKNCLKNYEALKKQYDDLLVKLSDTDFKAATYKRGLATLEGQIVKYREHEVRFSEEIALLKRSVGSKEYQMGLLRDELEKVKQEKEGFEFKIAKFDKSAKDLSEMLESQITNKSKKGVGYHAVPSPHPLILNRPTPLDLSYSGLEEFKEPEVNEYGPRDSSLKPTIDCDKESDNSKENTDDSLEQHQITDTETSSVKSSLKVNKDWKEKFFYPANHVREVEPKKVRENNDAPIIEDWVSDDEDEDEPNPKVEKKTVIPTATKKEFVKPQKPVKRSVRYAEMYRSKFPKGNQRNWNGQKSNQLGKDFVLYKKACYICGSFNHLQYNCHNHQKRGITYRNNNNRVHAKNTHPNVLRNMSPKAVLLNTGLTPLNTVKPVYTAHPKPTVHYARPKTHFFKSAQSTNQRPFYKKPTLTNRLFNHKINTVRPRVVNTARSYRTLVNTVRPRVVNTARPNRTSVNAVRARGFNAVKPSACWVWRPIKPNGASLSNSQVNDKGFVDSRCSRHMTGNIAHLSDFKDFDGGYVTFGGGAYGGRIIDNNTERKESVTLLRLLRTMLADSKLPTTFWAEAVSTACYVHNRVLIVKPHNKTPYELFRGFKPAIGFMKPFGCHVTILNTLDNLGKFDGKSDEENKPMIEGNGPKWLFDIDSLTQSMNYVPVVAGTFSNDFAGIQGVSESSTSSQQDQDCIVMPIWKDASYFGDDAPRSVADAQIQDKDRLQDENDATEKSHEDSSLKDNGEVSTAVPEVNTATPEDLVGPSHASEDTQVEDQEIELGNIPQSYAVPTTPHTRIHKDHPIEHEEPKRVSKALSDPAWVEAMQEELLQFKLQKVWILMDLPKGHRAIGTKWVYKNKKDERGIVIRNKARLVAQGHTQEEGIDYDEVFAHVARIEAIRMFLAYAFLFWYLWSTKWMYKMLSVGQIEEEVYVCQPLGFEDPDHPNKVYKTQKGISHLFKSMWMTLSLDIQEGIKVMSLRSLWKDKFQMSSMGELTFFLGLQVQQKKKGIFISQDKYVNEILRKYNYTDVKSASTPTDLEKPLVQDGDAADVDEHLYKSMIGSLMYFKHPGRYYVCSICLCRLIQMAKIDTEHNVADLLTKGFDAGRFQYLVSRSEGFHQFLNRSHICYALTKKPDVYISFIKQFWRSAEATNDDNGEVQITATIDGHSMTITEASLRRHLNPKKTAWEQFSSNIATAVICLATNRRYNFSSVEGSLTLNELTTLVTKLSKKVGELEDDLKKTRLTYSATVTKLILRVKKLETKLKADTTRKRAQVVLSEDDEDVEDDSSKQGRKLSDAEDFNQHIEPMDLEYGSERMKSPEKIEEEDVDTQKEMKEVSKESGAKRKKSLPRKSTRSIVKRQKMELDDEKEDLKGYLDIVPREDVAEDVESLSTKYPIVDWKTYTLSENFMYYKIIRGDGSSKNYKTMSEMLYDFDRQDIMELYTLVKERYCSSKPKGYDLMLWGDLHTLFEPDEESEIWMYQNEYDLISWSLCDLCGVHILLMQNGIAIHMLT